MKKILILITVIIPIYTFFMSVLIQYGYISYFGIPTDYISYNPKDTLLLSYNLLQVIWQIILNIEWYIWIIIIVIIIAIAYLLFDILRLKKIAWFIISIPFICFLFHCYNFGFTLAKLTTNFKIASTKCLSEDLNNYISPLTNSGEIIFVRIDNNKIVKNAVITRKISELPCGIEEKTLNLNVQ